MTSNKIGHSFKIYMKISNTAVRKNFYLREVLINGFPASTVKLTSVLEFQNADHRHMRDNKYLMF